MPSRVILASAGTGKTYALTLHALRLMLQSAAPRSILATTFTRKAAGEIQDRLLRRLVDAIESQEERSRLSREVSEPIAIDRCEALLGQILRSSERPSISTLDAFFARLARAHAIEIGLDPSWRIIDSDEDTALRDEAISDALDEPDPGATLVLLDMLSRGESRSVRDELRRAINETYSVYLETLDDPGLWLSVGPLGTPLDQAGIAAAARAARGMALPRGKSGEPNGHWVRARDALLAAIDSEDWHAIATKGVTAKLVSSDAPGQYYGQDITKDHRDALMPIAAHARDVLLGTHRDRALALKTLMDRFHRAYSQRKLDAGMLVFDDVPRALTRILAQGQLEHIYFRLDTRLHHVLLDEFQDTSRTQFALFEPILDELVSGSADRSVFVVGDPKQSLYGWRNAAPELLEALPDRWPQLEVHTLSGSWRSSPVVLDAVNTVFETLSQNPALDGQPGVEAWAQRFSPHTACHEHPLPGEATLTVAPGHESGPAHACVLAAADTAATRVRQAPWATIAILLRRNTLIAEVLHALHERGVPATGEGGSQIADSPAVAVALSLVHLGEHPGDSAAAYHVAESPLGPSFGLLDPKAPDQRVRVASDVRRRIGAVGYRRFLEELRSRMASAMDQRDARRVEQLIDLAGRFDQRPSPDADGFRAFVLTARVEMPERARVRVMTVHAAKGLDFDGVILPELGGDIGPRGTELTLLRPHPLSPPDGAVLSIEKNLAPLHPALERAADERRRRAIEQELCGLYVGMTRAIHTLDMIVPPPEDRQPRLSWATILAAALAPGHKPIPGETLWSHARGAWAQHRTAEPPPPPPTEIAPALLPSHASALARIRLTSPSKTTSRPIPLAPLFDPSAALLRVRGIALHAWLETIEWLDDWTPDEPALLGRARRLGLDGRAARADLRALLATLHDPASELRSLLCRSHYQAWEGQCEVHREWPFALIDSRESGSPCVLSGRIDRLVIARVAGRPTRAHVIDFKSGGSPQDAPNDHDEQLAAYRHAVAAALDLPESSVDAAVALVWPDRVVTPSPRPRGVNNAGP